MTSVVAKLYNGAGVQVAELPDFSNAQVQDKLNDENAWTLKYDRGGRNFDQLIQDADMSVKFFVDGSQIFEGVLEEDNWDEISDDTPVALAGRSWAGQFEFAKVYPKGGVNAKPAEWPFTNATPGKIFIDLLNAAHARGTVPNLTVNFTATTDSNGQPWAASSNLSITYKAGASLLDILKNFGTAGIADWRMNGKVLNMYNPRTFLGDQSGVIFRRGRDIKAAPRSRSRRKLGTVYLVGGDENVTVERVDSSAVAARGRKEQFVSQGGVQDTGTLAVVGDLNLTVFSANRMSKTHSLIFKKDFADQPRPWIDYVPGDYVGTDLVGTPENYRLIAMTVSMDANGFLAGEITLNDVFEEREILLDDALTKLTGGSSGTGASTTPGTATKDTTVPAAPTGLNGTSNVYVSGRGVQFAQATLNWAAVTQNTNGSSIDDFDRYDLQWWYTGEESVVHSVSSSDNLVFLSSLIPGKEFNYKVRAWDSNSHASAYSTTFNFDLDSDTTAPPVPSTPVAANYLGLLRVTWDGFGSAGENMPLDFRYTEVWYSTINNFTPGDANTFLFGTLPAKGSVNIAGLVYGTTYYVKLVSVDQIGNRSDPSAQASGTPKQVVQTDIGNNVIDFSNIRFKDVGNLIADGSFEFDTTASLINAQNPSVFQVVANPDGATAAPSPNVLRVTAPNNNSLVLTGQDMPVSPGQKFACIYSHRSSGLTGADFIRIQARWVLADGTTSFSNFKTWDSTTNNPVWTMREAAYVTAPANVVSYRIQVFGTAAAGSTLYLDQVEVRLQTGTVLIEDAAISNAKIALLAVNNANIQNVSAGKLTVGTLTADITVSARIKTADTGARVEINSGGIGAWNSSGTQTVSIASSNGSVNIIGQLRSGTAGQRIEINPTSTFLPEIRFYPSTGSNYGFLNAFSPSGSANAYVGLNSGQFTANSTTQVFRLYMTASEANLETVVSDTQARLGGRVGISPGSAVMEAKSSSGQGGYVTLYMGSPGTFNYGASIGHEGTSRSNDATLDIFQDGSMWMLGTWVRNMGQPEGALECDTYSASSTAAGLLWTWGATKDSTVYPVWGYRDNATKATTMDSLSTSGWGINIDGGSSGAYAIHWWAWR